MNKKTKKRRAFIFKKKRHKQKLKNLKIGAKCQDCPATKNLTWHHIRAKSISGKYILSNLALLCRKCHDKEHRKEREE